MRRADVGTRWRRARVLVAAALAAVTAGCAGGDAAHEAPAGPSRVGTGVRLPSQQGAAATSSSVARDAASGPAGEAGRPAGAAAPAAGTAVVTVRDARGPTRRGMLVLFQGPVTRTARTGADGRAEVSAPPGRYRVTVEEGCVEDAQITRGASAEVGLAEGDVARGELTADVRLRHVPTAGAYWREDQSRGSGRAEWRPGEVHVVEVTMYDRCSDGPAPAGAALGRMRFVPGEGLELVGPVPTVTGEGGRVQLRLRCTGPDVDGALDAVDAEVPADRTALFSFDVLEEQSAPFCSTA